MRHNCDIFPVNIYGDPSNFYLSLYLVANLKMRTSAFTQDLIFNSCYENGFPNNSISTMFLNLIPRIFRLLFYNTDIMAIIMIT